MPPDDPVAVIQALGDDTTRQLLAKLTDYAGWKMRRVSWRGVRFKRDPNAPGGCDAEDIVQMAVSRYLQGERNWNREACPTLLDFFRSVIDSIVSQLVNRPENKRSSPYPQASLDEGRAVPWDAPDLRAASPLSAVMDRDQAKAMDVAIKSVLANDPDAMKVWGCVAAGITKPQEIAELEDMDVKRVNNVKKRLNNKLEQVRRDFDRADRGSKGVRP